MGTLIERAAGLIRESEKILVFSGAGLSTESGIPDFRSPGGIWERYDPSEFYFQNFLASERARENYWKMSSEFYAAMREAPANPAHFAVMTLEESGRLLAVVTQNIDNLHQKAGNTPEKIIEIHGTAFSVSCLNCRKAYDREEIEQRLASGTKIPYCDHCGGILKPDTVSFGQAMPQEKMTRALLHARECDLCIVLGSSLVVYPAASIPAEAVRAGARLMIINRDATPLDSDADLVIHESVARVLPQVVKDLPARVTV